jgi:hypothetical protein
MKNMIPAIFMISIGVLSLVGVFAYAMTHQDNNNVWTFGNLTGSGQPQDQMTQAQKLFNQHPSSIITPRTYYEMAKANPNYVITERSVTAEDRGTGIGSSLAGGNGGSVAQGCTVIWQAVDPAHPDKGGPEGCY